MAFFPQFTISEPMDGSAIRFVCDAGRMLVREGADSAAPLDAAGMADCGVAPDGWLTVGMIGETPCFVTGGDRRCPVPDGFVWQDLRLLLGGWPDDLAAAAGYANHLWIWNQVHRFCGRCGQAMDDKPDERAKICPACELVNYPRVSPAVIVAVVDDDRILLARNSRFRGPFFSVLAGFVEPGETLEACVRREVMEEVGIRLDRIRYFGSQPWPFPDSLMVGFTARYAGGDLRVDHREILEADWYCRDDLPHVPPKFSIAGRLIDWFAKGGRP